MKRKHRPTQKMPNQNNSSVMHIAQAHLGHGRGLMEK